MNVKYVFKDNENCNCSDQVSTMILNEKKHKENTMSLIKAKLMEFEKKKKSLKQEGKRKVVYGQQKQ